MCTRWLAISSQHWNRQHNVIQVVLCWTIFSLVSFQVWYRPPPEKDQTFSETDCKRVLAAFQKGWRYSAAAFLLEILEVFRTLPVHIDLWEKNANTEATYAKRYNLILMTQYWFSPFIGMIQSFPCWNTNTANTIKWKDTAPGFFDWKDPKFRGHTLFLCVGEERCKWGLTGQWQHWEHWQNSSK